MQIKECRASVEFAGEMIGRIELEVEFEKGDHVSRAVTPDTNEAQRRAMQFVREVFTTSPGDATKGPSIYMWDGS